MNGEYSESHEHNSVSPQLYGRCDRRQVAVMMRVNCFADGVEYFMKTINLYKPLTQSFNKNFVTILGGLGRWVNRGFSYNMQISCFHLA